MPFPLRFDDRQTRWSGASSAAIAARGAGERRTAGRGRIALPLERFARALPLGWCRDVRPVSPSKPREPQRLPPNPCAKVRKPVMAACIKLSQAGSLNKGFNLSEITVLRDISAALI